MKHKIVLNQIKTFLIILLTVISQVLTAQNEKKYCCERELMFPLFPMPDGQERDISGMISSQWNSMILRNGAGALGKCPHPISVLSWDGYLFLDTMINNIVSTVTGKKPVYSTPDEARKRAEYIWIGKLELLKIDHLTPGHMEDTYIDKDTKPGSKHYEPGYARGRWKFSVKLYNPHWDEVVKEASTPEWEGSGMADEPIENLFNQHFANLKEIIWDYEQVPVKTELTPKKESVESGEKMDVKLKLFDDKDRPPKHWQRINVKVQHGKLENGAKCGDGSYNFLCDDGELDLKYVAPTKLNISHDTIQVYNACQTRHISVVTLNSICHPQDKIGEIPIKINPAITIYVRETESGFMKGGDPPYPYNFTVSMNFKGRAINSKSFHQIIPNLPESLRSRVMKEGSMSFKEECILIAELESDEKSMKVEKWECSDPVNNTPPPPLLAASPPNFFVSVRIWQIGEKIYISHGFVDGIHGYFPSWDDPRSSNKEQPFGARCEGTFGKMGEYIEVPYGKFINGETIVLHPKDVSDHNDDVWHWQTNWTVTINPQ